MFIKGILVTAQGWEGDDSYVTRFLPGSLCPAVQVMLERVLSTVVSAIVPSTRSPAFLVQYVVYRGSGPSRELIR